MKVKATIAFTGRVGGKVYHVNRGDVFDLPAHADWLKAGLVEAVGPVRTNQPVETATVKPPESRRKRKPK